MVESRTIAGVDEVGRGTLAGDVVTAAVILDPENPVDGLADSKKLTERRREQLYEEITSKAVCWSVGRASVTEIDTMNILAATMLAMDRAVQALDVQPEHILVDGNRLPAWKYSAEAVIGGDGTIPCISAASIVAKVTRDREMALMENRYPGYGFKKHKGYGTSQHREAILALGPCGIHRTSFEPVKSILNTYKT